MRESSRKALLSPPGAREALTMTSPVSPAETEGGGGGAGGGGAASDGDCSAVTVIAARGTGEPAGTGFLLGQVSRQIDSRVDVPVTIVGLDYPAAPEFVNSPRQGVAELRRLVDAADDCLVLLGYSQGAIVVGDALAGFSASNGAKVRAVVMFGDPRFNSAEPYNLGTFGTPSRGLNPRRTGELAAFNERIQDYCNGGDVVCQGSGRAGGDGHLAYGQFAARAATFVAGRV
jgi:acetylxylan esterase